MSTEPPEREKNRWVAGLRDPVTWIIAAVAAVIAGVLIEYVLKPSLSWVTKLVFDLMNTVSSSWANIVYHDAVGETTIPVVTEYALIILTSILFLFFLRERQHRLSSDDDEREIDSFHEKISVMTDLTVAITLFLLTIFTVATNVKMAEIRDTYTRRSLVLSPLLSDLERRTLDAKWGSVTKKSDFDALMSQMETIATASKVKLPTNQGG